MVRDTVSQVVQAAAGAVELCGRVGSRLTKLACRSLQGGYCPLLMLCDIEVKLTVELHVETGSLTVVELCAHGLVTLCG